MPELEECARTQEALPAALGERDQGTMTRSQSASSEKPELTDSIPRARIEQILGVLAQLAEAGVPLKFQDVRLNLLHRSRRAAPSAPEALWTVARDILGDLSRLGLARVGVLPRKRSDVAGAQHSPCEATSLGIEIGALFRRRPGQAYDRLLREWLAGHVYFRALLRCIEHSPLFVPDITSIKQLGADRASPSLLNELGPRVLESLTARVRIAGWEEPQIERLSAVVAERMTSLGERVDWGDATTKAIVDAVQDGVVLPAVLKAQDLPFDAVTFQHLLKVSQEFLVAAWTSSHVSYPGRVVFPTCDFRPDGVLAGGALPATLDVVYHGRTYATERFAAALIAAWKRLSEARGGYVDIYGVRALVCVELKITPMVFDACLDHLRESSPGFEIYTELPFGLPPAGEDYVKLGAKRIGLIKLVLREGN